MNKRSVVGLHSLLPWLYLVFFEEAVVRRVKNWANNSDLETPRLRHYA